MTAETRERLAPSFAAQGWHDLMALALIRQSQARCDASDTSEPPRPYDGTHAGEPADASADAADSAHENAPLACDISFERLSDGMGLPSSVVGLLLPLAGLLLCLLLLAQCWTRRLGSRMERAAPSDQPPDILRAWPHLALWLDEEG